MDSAGLWGKRERRRLRNVGIKEEGETMDKEFVVRVKTPDIWPLKKPVLAIRLKCGNVDLACEQELVSVEPMGFAGAAEFALNHLLAAEAIAPVVHGKFIELNIDDEMKPSEFQCSVCGHTEELFMITPEELEWKYCPHCGAKMDGETE